MTIYIYKLIEKNNKIIPTLVDMWNSGVFKYSQNKMDRKGVLDMHNRGYHFTSEDDTISKFEIPDEFLEAIDIDPKKLKPEQVKAIFAKLKEKGLLNDKPSDKKSDKKPVEKQPEGAQGTGRTGLVKKKVTVHRGGKTFQQERWVKAGEEEPVEKPKKVEEKPPEKPKGPVITGLNKPEDEVEEPEEIKGKEFMDWQSGEPIPGGVKVGSKVDIGKFGVHTVTDITGGVIIGEDDKPYAITSIEDVISAEPEKPEEKVEPTTKMTKENVDSVESFAEMDIAGGINQDVSNIVKFKDGSKGIYKVVDKISDQGENNVAELQSILGWDNAPETVIDNFGKGDGSCQKWVENTVSISNADPWSQDEPVKLEEKHYDDLSKIYLMDLITGNFDRHAGNVKLDEDGKVWAIDNDTWGSKSDYGTVIDEDFSMSEHHFWMGIDPKDDDQKAKFQTYVTKNAEHIVKNKEVITKFIKDLAKRSGEFNTLYKERTKKREEDEEIDYFIPKTHKEATGNMVDNLNKVIEHKSEYKSWWSEE